MSLGKKRVKLTPSKTQKVRSGGEKEEARETKEGSASVAGSSTGGNFLRSKSSTVPSSNSGCHAGNWLSSGKNGEKREAGINNRGGSAASLAHFPERRKGGRTGKDEAPIVQANVAQNARWIQGDRHQWGEIGAARGVETVG